MNERKKYISFSVSLHVLVHGEKGGVDSAQSIENGLKIPPIESRSPIGLNLPSQKHFLNARKVWSPYDFGLSVEIVLHKPCPKTRIKMNPKNM